MAITVAVTFSVLPTSEQIQAMKTWITPYLTAGNTSVFPLDTVGDQLFREWDTVENAQAFMTKVNEIYTTATSVEIVA